MEYAAYYFSIGFIFWIFMFCFELYNHFIKHKGTYEYFSWFAVFHGFAFVVTLWPWTVPFYIYERI